jgi:hypothetical protein
MSKNVKSKVRIFTLRLPNFVSCFYLRNTGRRRMLACGIVAKLTWSGLGMYPFFIISSLSITILFYNKKYLYYFILYFVRTKMSESVYPIRFLTLRDTLNLRS